MCDKNQLRSGLKGLDELKTLQIHIQKDGRKWNYMHFTLCYEMKNLGKDLISLNSVKQSLNYDGYSILALVVWVLL